MNREYLVCISGLDFLPPDEETKHNYSSGSSENGSKARGSKKEDLGDGPDHTGHPQSSGSSTAMAGTFSVCFGVAVKSSVKVPSEIRRDGLHFTLRAKGTL